MNIFLALLAIVFTLFLNFTFTKRIQNKTYRICISIGNVLVALIFSILIITAGSIKKPFTKFLNQQIENIKSGVESISPGTLDAQMDTSEIKNILEQASSFEGSGFIEKLVIDYLTSGIKKYASLSLKAIKSIEGPGDKISIRQALESINQITSSKFMATTKAVEIVLCVLTVIYYLIALIISVYYSKGHTKENKSIVFGDAADTSLGMKVDD